MIKTRMRWAGDVAHMGTYMNAYTVLVGKPEGKTPLQKATYRWDNNSKITLTEIGLYGMDCIRLSQDRDKRQDLVSTVMNLRVP
jgi:hypothetical protein